jgi:hypothetical protein
MEIFYIKTYSVQGRGLLISHTEKKPPGKEGLMEA